jgi:hypothetical protein
VLAKIAHSYMAAEVGLKNVKSYLTDFIRRTFSDEDESLAPYTYVGGSPLIEPESDSLHEIGWAPVGHGYLIYVVVRIRLFANLGTPTYYVVPGYFTNLSMFQKPL